MISKERLANIETVIDKHKGLDGLIPTTVLELVEEVRQLQEQVEYQAGLAIQQGVRIRGLKEELEEAQKESPRRQQEAEQVALRLTEDAYWRRVEWMTGQFVTGYVTGCTMRDVMLPHPPTVISEARDYIDELDRQRHNGD
jgi:predicted RNase H-like nuclease